MAKDQRLLIAYAPGYSRQVKLRQVIVQSLMVSNNAQGQECQGGGINDTTNFAEKIVVCNLYWNCLWFRAISTGIHQWSNVLKCKQ